MIRTRRFLLSVLALVALALPLAALAAQVRHSTVAVGGYDLVSYHTGEKPLPGNGNHLVVHEDATYLFANEANRKAFAKDPQRYLPAYGGYCAYGVAVGKKFVGDPHVWELVDGRLYLNLDNKVKGLWLRDVPGHIQKADSRWPRIAGIAPAEL